MAVLQNHYYLLHGRIRLVCLREIYILVAFSSAVARFLRITSAPQKHPLPVQNFLPFHLPRTAGFCPKLCAKRVPDIAVLVGTWNFAGRQHEAFGFK